MGDVISLPTPTRASPAQPSDDDVVAEVMSLLIRARPEVVRRIRDDLLAATRSRSRSGS